MPQAVSDLATQARCCPAAVHSCLHDAQGSSRGTCERASSHQALSCSSAGMRPRNTTSCCCRSCSRKLGCQQHARSTAASAVLWLDSSCWMAQSQHAGSCAAALGFAAARQHPAPLKRQPHSTGEKDFVVHLGHGNIRLYLFRRRCVSSGIRHGVLRRRSRPQRQQPLQGGVALREQALQQRSVKRVNPLAWTWQPQRISHGASSRFGEVASRQVSPPNVETGQRAGKDWRLLGGMH
jgi:hypothetical protein